MVASLASPIPGRTHIEASNGLSGWAEDEVRGDSEKRGEKVHKRPEGHDDANEYLC